MKKVSQFLLKIYKTFVSGIIKLLFGGGCRFSPTCSDYAAEAIHKHGLIKGGGLAFKRILKCRPGGECGTDLVP